MKIPFNNAQQSKDFFSLSKFCELPLLNFSKSEGFRIEHDPGDFSNILNSFNMCKFGVTGMVPAQLKNEVPPNFNTHIKNQRMPIGTDGYTLKREFAVALNPYGTISAKLVKMGTKEIKCPKCHQKVQAIISRCTFKLKGGGWYSDGYSSSLFGTEN